MQEVTNNQLFEYMTMMYGELKGDITEIKGEITEMKSDITEMKSDITEMKDEITEVKGEITEMKGEITEMKSDITEMKGEITEMKGEITEMKGDQVGFRQTLAMMEVKNEERFNILFEGYTANTEAIVELKHQVQHLEKVVTQHEVKLKVVK